MSEPTLAPEVPAEILVDPGTIRRVIFASSLGTLFEWYDFYLYGSLAVFFGSRFFPPGNETAQLLASLATFGAGFGVRPLGALVFGQVGDLIGRKYTFLVTMATMGLSTALVGFLPTYEHIGIWATIILVFLRLLQGLALGGEYGGAATYVAEHVPDARRGYYTAYIQTTATVGFFLSMAIIGTTRLWMGEEAFKNGTGAFISGWRIPFLLSFILLAVSLYIRIKMQESPLFSKLKSKGNVSKNPLKESFTNPVNLRYVLLALFGATAGQGVVWYTGQFHALTFLQATLKFHWLPAYTIIAVALLFGTPLFLFFGHLSDRIGRKKIMLWGCALAAATYVPIYMAMRAFTPVVELSKEHPAILMAQIPAFNLAMLMLLVFIQIVYVTMVYGPIAAFLVELFPTNIRYTSMSLPYHLGNGWFGGFLPLIATAVAASAATKEAFGTGAIFAGLIYPIAIALITLVVGSIFIKETQGHKIDTAIHTGAATEPFDWGAVLISLGLGFVIFMASNSGFRADLARLGIFKAVWNDLWYPLFGAAGLFALPTIFFRLEYQRYRSIVTVFGCLAATWLISIFLVPFFLSMGGMFKFFAYTLILGIHTVILTVAYRTGLSSQEKPPAQPTTA